MDLGNALESNSALLEAAFMSYTFIKVYLRFCVLSLNAICARGHNLFEKHFVGVDTPLKEAYASDEHTASKLNTGKPRL